MNKNKIIMRKRFEEKKRRDKREVRKEIEE
jgi:hypothetical protein